MSLSSELPVAEVFDVDSLWRSVVAAIGAGVAIVLSFSLALLGWVRARHHWLERARRRAVPWGALALLAGLAFIAEIVLGLMVMATN